jgi:hypothetical protein
MDGGMSTDKKIGYYMLPCRNMEPAIDAIEVLFDATGNILLFSIAYPTDNKEVRFVAEKKY